MKNLKIFILIILLSFLGPIYGVVQILFINSSGLDINSEGSVEFEKDPIEYNSEFDFSKLKTSSKTVNISGVPYYDQLVYYWCGGACLQMVYDFYGENVSQLEIADVARTEPNEGTWEDDMRRATHFSNISTSVGNEIAPSNITGYSNRPYGYTSFEQHFTNASDLTYLIDAGYPIIVLQWMTNNHIFGHFRVVVGYEAFDNGTIDKFFLLDPWPAYPDLVEQNYSKFLEYRDFSSNWSVFINPLDVQINHPSIVERGSSFTVSATVNYTYPIYSITPELYNLTSCNATINLPSGFSLASGETFIKEVNNGILPAGNVATVQWEVVADQSGTLNPINITIDGLVNGTVQDHPSSPAPGYNYTDWIRGLDSSTITVIEENQYPAPLDDPSDSIYGFNLWIIVATIFIGLMIRNKNLLELYKKK